MRILLPSYFLENQSLKNKTYYKMGGIARYFAQPTNISQVQESLFWCKKNNLPCSILGSGSNSIYSDEEFEGVIISLEKLAKWFWETDEFLFIEAGVTNTEVSEICLAANRGGASWLYRMPGQMGASIRMNARCYGGEVSQIIQHVYTIDSEGTYKTYLGNEIFKGYKNTTLMKAPEIVVGARLYFPQILSPEKILKHMLECEMDRHKKNHFYMPSCGSTFKNNYEIGKPSGQLFDELGFKGTKIGNVEVSEFHANFIWNTDNAKTKDFLSLVSLMRTKAKTQVNAELELEVQPVGAFPNDLYEQCGMKNLGPSFEQNDKMLVGLLYYPNKNKIVNNIINQHNSFPYKIFESPFLEFFQIPFHGCPTTGVQITQITSLENAKRHPELPFLEWTTYITENPDKIFSEKISTEQLKNNEKFYDNLWKYSVSELFIANLLNPTKNYFEFEITPQGEWVAIEFNDVRQRTSRNKLPTKSIWNYLKINELCVSFYNNSEMRYIFGMSFSYKQLEKLFSKEENFIFIQCALSLGNNKYFLAPYWKNNDTINETKEKIDFHQPQKFWKLKLF